VSRIKLYGVEGIVLGRRDQGEADRVVLLLTPEGRLDLLARGVRKPRSRKAGHLELFSRTKVLIRRVKNSWDMISQAELVRARTRLQEDFDRGTYARYAAELVVRSFEREADPALYSLVDRVLEFLDDEDTDPEQVIRWFEHQLLSLAGFRPELSYCVGERDGEPCGARLCPRPDDNRSYGMDLARGGVLCPKCLSVLRGGTGVGPLSPSALSWMQAFQRRTFEELATLALPAGTAAELRRVMDRYISYHLERRPATLRALGRGTGTRSNGG
jgi:DNA repair protein RecO (recombination protein O)